MNTPSRTEETFRTVAWRSTTSCRLSVRAFATILSASSTMTFRRFQPSARSTAATWSSPLSLAANMAFAMPSNARVEAASALARSTRFSWLVLGAAEHGTEHPAEHGESGCYSACKFDPHTRGIGVEN